MSDEVAWCLKKLSDALDDYNLEDAKAYLELSKQWLAKEV